MNFAILALFSHNLGLLELLVIEYGNEIHRKLRIYVKEVIY